MNRFENTVDDVQEGVVDLPEDDSVASGAGEAGQLEQPMAEPEGIADPQESRVQTPEENAAFAAMRRKTELLEQEIAQRDEMLGTFFNSENPLLEAKAFQEGKSVEDLQAELIWQQEQAKKDGEIAELRAFKAQSTFERDLSAIKKAYPDLTAKSIEDLGDQFVQIMASSRLDPVTAYEVVRAQEERNKITPPPEIGKVNQNSAANKEYYTPEEVKSMSQEEVHKNWEKIEKSRKKWK